MVLLRKSSQRTSSKEISQGPEWSKSLSKAEQPQKKATQTQKLSDVISFPFINALDLFLA